MLGVCFRRSVFRLFHSAFVRHSAPDWRDWTGRFGTASTINEATCPTPRGTIDRSIARGLQIPDMSFEKFSISQQRCLLMRERLSRIILPPPPTESNARQVLSITNILLRGFLASFSSVFIITTSGDVWRRARTPFPTG